jgi:YVTN family beta-propeller protein
MKNSIFIISVFGLISCMDMSNVQPEQNINYPAAFIVNGESSTLSVINLNTNEVSTTIQLTDGSSTSTHGAGHTATAGFLAYPHHIYINTTKSQIAIAAPGVDLSAGHTGETHVGTGKIAVLDAIKGVNVKIFEVPMSNHNAVFSPDGKELWTSQSEGKILVYDATNYALKNTIIVGKGSAEVTFSFDGTVAFVANGEDNTVSAINPTSKAILATIPVGKNPVGAWVGADSRMYVDNEDGQTVSIIDVKTLKVVETVVLGFMPGFVAYQADMKEMWVTDPTAGKVHWWTKGTDGTMTRTGSFATGAGSHAIAFNAMSAYVTNQEAASVSVIDIMQHKVTKTLNVGLKPNGIVIKP